MQILKKQSRTRVRRKTPTKIEQRRALERVEIESALIGRAPPTPETVDQFDDIVGEEKIG